YTRDISLNSTLWRMPVTGGAETKVLQSVAYSVNFAVLSDGIYFIPYANITYSPLSRQLMPSEIQFLNFATGKIKTILAVTNPLFAGLAVTPDRRSVLYSLVDHLNSEIMLAENFQW